jgi:hypothetical protein
MALSRLFVYDTNDQRHREIIAQWINGLLDGKLDIVGTFTLTANTTTTAVADNKFESNMIVLWVPTTANAAAEIGAGTLYLSSRGVQTFTLTHANNAQTDRTFLYVRLG